MQAKPATTKESISAGPVLSWAATPVRTKMPVPMTAPTPRAESWTGPRQRRKRLSLCISSYNIDIGLRAKSWLRAIIASLRTSGRTSVSAAAHHKGPARPLANGCLYFSARTPMLPRP
jgi:hypothetical protein